MSLLITVVFQRKKAEPSLHLGIFGFMLSDCNFSVVDRVRTIIPAFARPYLADCFIFPVYLVPFRFNRVKSDQSVLTHRYQTLIRAQIRGPIPGGFLINTTLLRICESFVTFSAQSSTALGHIVFE